MKGKKSGHRAFQHIRDIITTTEGEIKNEREAELKVDIADVKPRLTRVENLMIRLRNSRTLVNLGPTHIAIPLLDPQTGLRYQTGR